MKHADIRKPHDTGHISGNPVSAAALDSSPLRFNPDSNAGRTAEDGSISHWQQPEARTVTRSLSRPMGAQVLSINTFLAQLVIWNRNEIQIEFISRFSGSRGSGLEHFHLRKLRDGTETGLRRA